MCFFSAPKTPDAPPPPPPPPTISPAPQVIPSQNAETSEFDRVQKQQKLRYGLASTIKTGPLGIVDTQAAPTGKTTLG